MKFSKIMLVGFIISLFQTNAFAVNIRANELNNKVIASIFSGQNVEYVVEFREGDLVPLNFVAGGDLFESKDNTNNIFVIKKDFFIKVKNNSVMISMDGNSYMSLRDVISGKFSIGSDIDRSQIPGVIQALLSVYLK